MAPGIPLVDVLPWFAGDTDDRREIARQVDEALQQYGFMLVTGHGVPAERATRLRAAAREFFALPRDVKEPYRAGVDGRGWLPTGVEANGFSEGTQTPPDLKESLTFGADRPTGNAAIDARWFQPNVWPSEVPAVRTEIDAYTAEMHGLADRLMALCADALGLGDTWFEPFLTHPTYTVNVNHYPPMTSVGRPQDGQFRIGPHTDFGTLTLLDREPGAGGLQVFTAGGEWVDAPFVEGALTVNIGDLLARWTGGRWMSARHRVLPPQDSAPEEDLVSLVFFYECNTDALIESMPPPIGHKRFTPVYAADYLDQQYQAIALSD